jgi:MFS family permease
LDTAGKESTPAWPPSSRGWLAVFLLALASIVSQWDRTVINLMVAPIKEAFSLSDTRFGALQSLAFGIFYVLACIPIGRLSDRFQRRHIISIGIALWSLFAMASGLARSYTQLFLTRIGVAVGEASLTPAGFSMLSDLFPPQRLGRPMGAFLMSSPVGQGLAYIGGGALLQWLTTSSVLAATPLSGLAPWQAAFVVIGLPGLLLVPLFLMYREPIRRGRSNAVPLSTREMIQVVRARSNILVPMFAGFAMVPLVSYAFGIWTPALFQRTWGWNPAQVGLAFGSILLMFGTAGAFFGGYMADRLAARGVLDAPLKVAAFGFVGCGVFGALAPLMPSAEFALVMLAPAIFLSNTPYACAGTAIQQIMPNRARAQVTAIYITITTLVGLGLGPLVVGIMTDYVFHDPADIRYSLAIVVALPAPILFVLLSRARRPFRELRAQEQA